jgi:iron complex outermembrane receptor protein
MKQVNINRLLASVIMLLFMAVTVNAQNAITGKVIDESGEALFGASIVIKGTGTGTVTDIDGSFRLNTSEALPVTLEVSYTGFSTEEVEVSSYGVIEVVLAAGVYVGETVVVSASRKREKVQEAPASISVVSARKLQTSAQTTDAVRNLVNVPGVQIQQQSAARINIEMRGSAGLFGTGVFPILDYRSLIGPGIGTFQSDASGISSIDLARIEVVRGPGSALYGPGVAAGVIHFISKNPIDFPGTTVEMYGGQLSTFGGAVRHAGRSENRKFGYKINAQYRRGDEFTLDLEEDADQIAKFQTSISQPVLNGEIVDVTKPGEVLLSQGDLDPDGDGNMMQDFWENTSVNATLEFRPQDDLGIFVSGGFNSASAVFYNNQGEGLTQAQEIWTQARVQKGGLFAQLFYVDNDGGTRDRPTFLYQTGLRTPVARKQLEGQLQYNFQLPSILNSDWTAGFDYRSAISDTENLVYGRNEDDDDYSIIGAYLQGKFELGSKLDLVLAGRFDQFNFLDDNSIAPRAALVYKPNPKHTFRATFNQATTPPSALEVNIDFPVSIPVPGLFDIWLAGQKESHTFDNPMIDITIPGVPDLPWGTPGLPLAVPYGAVAGQVLEQLLPLLAQDPNVAPLVPGLQAYFADPANAPAGFTGVFAPYNIFNGQPMTELSPTIPARLSTINSFEIGYKGLIADKLSVMVDWYYIERSGFTQFTAVGPTIALAGADVAGDLNAAITADMTEYLLAQGLDQATAGGLAAIIGGAFGAGGQGFDDQVSALYSIIGAVESNRMPTDDGIVHVPAGYRTFADESFDYWGLDIGLEYYFNSDLSAFLNYSYVSQNLWVPGEADDDDLPFQWSLNVPQSKYRLGVNYIPATGVRGSLSFQHDDSFFADFGQFSGDTDVKNLVDLSVGYSFDNGLAIDLTAQNLFDNEYRAFPNFPKIGRRALAKITYTFGGDQE